MPFSTVNYSVPLEIKEAFNAAFATENKSAVIARLMQSAIEERERQNRRAVAIDALLDLRKSQVPVSAAAVEAARRQGRP